MANTKVEILGNQLSGTIVNAASDATLQEIVRAVNSMNKNLGKSNAGGGPVGPSIPNSPSSSGSIIGKAAGAVADQIGNVIGAFGSFAGLLAAGNDKLSAYTNVISNQVLKEIPVVGRVLGIFGDTVSYTIEQFESWNKSLKSASQAGASFNNSILELRENAARSYLSLDDFVDIVKRNSEALVGFGGTVSEGARTFAHYSESIRKQGGVGREIFRQIGYDSKRLGEAVMNFMKLTMRGQDRTKVSDEQFNRNFGVYQLNLEKLAKISGLSAEKLQEQMDVAAQDLAYQRETMKAGPDGAAKMNAALAMFTTMYGQAGAELYKAAVLGVEPMSMEAQLLKNSIGGLNVDMQQAVNSARDANVKVKDYPDLLRELYRKQAGSVIDFVNGQGDLLKIYSLLDNGNNEYNRAFQGVSASYMRFAQNGTVSVDNAMKNYDDAQIELGKRNELTKFLNDMSLAFEEFKKEFVIAMMPYFRRIGDAIKDYDMPGLFQKLGESLVYMVRIGIPTVEALLRGFETENGREFIKSEMEYFFTRMLITVKYAFMRAFVKEGEHEQRGLTAKHQEAEVAQAKQARVSRAAAAGVTISGDSNFMNAQPLPAAGSGTTDPNATVSPGDQGATLSTRPIKIDELGGKKVPRVDLGKAERDPGSDANRRTSDYLKSGLPAGLGLPMDPSHFTLVSGMGMRDGRIHWGNDLGPSKSMEKSDIPIRAIAGGRAVFDDRVSHAQGYTMLIYHPDHGITSMYMHLDPKGFDLMKSLNGKDVSAGQHIGYMGNTGTSTGRHLHFELRQGDAATGGNMWGREGTQVDPRQIFGYSSGTLGKEPTGPAQLDIAQMENIAAGGGDLNLQQLVSDFNNNMTSLIRLTEERKSLHREQIDHTRRLSGNLFGM